MENAGHYDTHRSSLNTLYGAVNPLRGGCRKHRTCASGVNRHALRVAAGSDASRQPWVLTSPREAAVRRQLGRRVIAPLTAPGISPQAPRGDYGCTLVRLGRTTAGTRRQSSAPDLASLGAIVTALGEGPSDGLCSATAPTLLRLAYGTLAAVGGAHSCTTALRSAALL